MEHKKTKKAIFSFFLKISYLFNHYHLVLKPILADSLSNTIYFMCLSII